MRTDNTITEITLDDFLKLNLVGYERRWKDFVDEEGKEYRKLVWNEINLNDEVLENMNWEDNEEKTVVVAIHKNWEKAKLQNHYDFFDFYYYDKWLNKLGASTFILGADIKKLYKGSSKWYIKEDYFEIPYKETEKIYFIKKS